MSFSREDSCTAFTDAAGWFLRTAALVGDRWGPAWPGEWDVRALAGHEPVPDVGRAWHGLHEIVPETGLVPITLAFLDRGGTRGRP